jgi:hypothetical protein
MKLGFNGRQGKKVFFIGILAAIFFIALGLLFVRATPTNATEEQEVPDEISIDNTVYKTDRKGSVLFSHSEHADGYVESCDGCHHEYKDGQNIWEEGQPVKKCFSCHDPSKRDGRIRKLNIAYHKNCKGCHRELAREGGTQAPYRQCTDCHEKR